jgi:hypothetical protein
MSSTTAALRITWGLVALQMSEIRENARRDAQMTGRAPAIVKQATMDHTTVIDGTACFKERDDEPPVSAYVTRPSARARGAFAPDLI